MKQPQKAPLVTPIKITLFIEAIGLLTNKHKMSEEQAYQWLVKDNEAFLQKPITCFHTRAAMTVVKHLKEMSTESLLR